MAEDIMAMYRELANRRANQEDQALLSELVERANAIVAASEPVDKEQATAFMECLCAAKIRLHDDGENNHLVLVPLVYRFQLPLAVSNVAVRNVLDKPHNEVTDYVVDACAIAVVECMSKPSAPKPVSGPDRSARPAPAI